MARGIDFKGVKLVINYDFPSSMVNYVHRVGRTGRAGRVGRALTFFTNSDKPFLRSLANVLKVSGCEVPDWIFELSKGNKKLLKHAAKFPTKREHISLKPALQANLDHEYRKTLALASKRFKKQSQSQGQE